MLTKVLIENVQNNPDRDPSYFKNVTFTTEILRFTKTHIFMLLKTTYLEYRPFEGLEGIVKFIKRISKRTTVEKR